MSALPGIETALREGGQKLFRLQQRQALVQRKDDSGVPAHPWIEGPASADSQQPLGFFQRQMQGQSCAQQDVPARDPLSTQDLLTSAAAIHSGADRPVCSSQFCSTCAQVGSVCS